MIYTAVESGCITAAKPVW